MTVFMKPKDAFTSRIICDLRPLNSRYPTRPPRFPLPSVGLLTQLTASWPQVFYTKLDVAAYFHSLVLNDAHLSELSPPDLQQYPFIFTVEGHSWKWLRLPFGWAWSPILAQLQMLFFVHDTNPASAGVLALVYYDDVLLAAPSPAAVEASTQRLVSHLQEKGLRLNRKCLLSAVPEIEWLGKVPASTKCATLLLDLGNSLLLFGASHCLPPVAFAVS
jgi:hypothetical protein